jgi:ribosomal protein L37E
MNWIKKKFHQWFMCKHNWQAIGKERLCHYDDFMFVFQKHKCLNCGLTKDRHMTQSEWNKECNKRFGL